MVAKRTGKKLPKAGKLEAEAREEDATRPRQVVEVVEEVEEKEKGEALETIKKDAQEIEEEAEKLEEVVEPERQKEMVAQLFQKETPEVSPEITVHTPSRTKPLVIWAALTLGIALAVGTVMVLVVRGTSLPSLGTKPTPTPTAAPAPTSTPTPASLVREDLQIEVLNGGGVAGAASKMKALLEGKGYVVARLGNTKEYSYTKTEIMVKAGKEAYLSLLTEDLGEDYTLATSSATLEEDSPYDVRVIVGKE